MNYTHFTQKERYQIYALLREGFSKRYIAQHAHKLAPRCHCSNPKTILPETWNVVKCYLQLQSNPEHIASHAVVSLHSVYRQIQQDENKGSTLYQYLRFRNQRKRKYGSPKTRGQLSNRKSIHDGPPEIEQRIHFGDLEIDTIVGKKHQQSLVSIVDRETDYLWLKKCSSRKSIAEITNRLNHCPRKRLGFRSPSQVFFQEHGVATSNANL